MSTYHDTDDLRFARWGASLRYRATEGWTVKLPQAIDGAITVRQEHTFEGGPGTSRRPRRSTSCAAIVRGGDLGPVARLQTVRQRTRIVR